MKVLFFFILLIKSVYPAGGLTDTTAFKTSTKAFLAYPTIKQYKKNVEDKIYRKLPVSKNTAVAIGSTIMTVTKGSINTKVIKKMDIRVFGGKARPDVDYNFKDNRTVSTININWSF